MRDSAAPGAALAIACVWVLQEAAILTASALPARAALLALGATLALGFVAARPRLRVVCAVALGAAAVLAARFAMPSALLQGAHSAALFVAFLASMQMLKVCIELGPGIDRARREHALLDPAGQHDAMLLRAWLTASIFAAGSLAIVAPLVGAERSSADRRRLAQAALQGVALALLWSPFFVAMAVCVRLSTRITLPAAVANGLAMAVLGLAISHLAFGGRLKRQWIVPLWRVLAATVAMTVVAVGTSGLLGLSSFEAIIATVPWIALFIARDALRSAPWALARRWVASLQTIAPEAVLVGASLMLGEAIKVLIDRGVLAVPLSMDSLPVPLLLVWPSFAMAALSFAGLHPIIGASLLFPLQGSLTVLHPLAAAGSVMVGWMLAIVVSTFAVPVLFAASMFGVPASDVVRTRTLRFVLIFTPSAWLYLWLLDRSLPVAG